MENSASASPEADGAPRRSGRVSKAPSKYVDDSDARAANKRKRGAQAGDEDGADGLPDLDDDESDDDDNESDGDHAEPKPRKKKPSTKKAKTNGTALSIPSRPKKTVRIDVGEGGSGLFADIFGSGDGSASVANQWLEKYQTDDAAALCDLVNCILQCAGCDQEVTADDVRDPENIPNRLIDLQSIYQDQQITDYPLISRAKGTRSFRDLLVHFFESLIALLHETDVMYKDADLMDNLHAWLASMSSSTLRPFRHTATTISLAVQSGLIGVADTLDRRIGNIEQQLQASKKGKANKTKTAEISSNLEEANDHRRACSEAIQSYFDTVFVHRYRDVDPKIRTECVEALGHWIWNLPTVFMEPGYLRYLGWMLSDTNAPTRQEVLKQLLRVFKRDSGKLGHFIDRFRPRLIEMATLDSEISVRVAAISVIDALRTAQLLEPGEIDAIGKLIFDSEIRIRKAVVGFFVSCVEEVVEGKLESMGEADPEERESLNVDVDDFESRRFEWLNISCLAETLAIYDAQIEESQQNGMSVAADVAVDILEASTPDTRISLASQVLYERVPEVKQWQMLNGYLLYDHSKLQRPQRSSAAGWMNSFEKQTTPTPAEEAILLDVLASAVKSSLQQTNELDKSKRKGGRSEATEAQEEIASELAAAIPRLLSKFGAVPETAAVVLRLEHCLNLDIFQQIRQSSSKYEKLLDEISTQFNRHDDKRVLAEAAAALLHARQYDELEEVVDGKLSFLWENAINSLRKFDKTCEISVRGNLDLEVLRQLSTLVMKMSKLASIADCVDVMESDAKAGSPAIQILSNIVHRGKYEPQEDEIDDLEDEIVSLAIKACQFYFMWKVHNIQQLLASGASLPDNELNELSVLRQTYRRYLIETLSSRAAIDQTRLFATGSLCDLHLTFATLRPYIERFRSNTSSTQAAVEKLRTLQQEIEPAIVPEFISIFDGAEKQFAKRTKKDKALNEPADDEDPMADDEDLDEENEDEGLSPEEKYAAGLTAEKALCELTSKFVLAITAKILDNRGPQAGKLRRRLLRNQTKLGNNFKEIVAFLDEDKLARRAKKTDKPEAAKPPMASGALGGIEDAEEDIFDDFEPEEGSRDDLRARGLLEDDPIVDDAEDEDTLRPLNDEDDDILGD